MRSRTTSLVLAAVVTALVASTASAAERFEDAVGDATGEAPDIVAVTVSEHEGEFPIRFDIELAPGRLFGSDMETWTDMLLLAVSFSDELDDRGILNNEQTYVTGTHGLTLEMHRDSGAPLAVPEDIYDNLIDFDDAEGTVSFGFQRELVGEPRDFYFQVLLGVERFDDEEDAGSEGDSEEEAEGDAYPEIGQPPAHYRIGTTDG
jgi:hypothetical protein